MKKLEEYIRCIPDFPKPGILFRDITTILQDADGLRLAVDTLEELASKMSYDVVIGAESRGFIFGTPLAYNQRKPFVPVRKSGKLPGKVLATSYDLEYGQATLEIHQDSIAPGQKVLIVDDLLATGGTMEAMIRLVEQLGAKVAGIVVLIELAGFCARERLVDYSIASALCYDEK
ncbi:MAG: adenine phosphoribosyltransferase [Clostridium sp.]|jgi:adenine phosphoribosyltransferase|nr:adenine phosphoribosyltransferase [Clostridium sp.]